MTKTKLIFSSVVSSEYRKLVQFCHLSEHKIDTRIIRQAFVLACEASVINPEKKDEELLLYSLGWRRS